MSVRHRRHRWIALFALIGLLFQQVAMATYLCPVEQSGHASSAMHEARAQLPCHADSALAEAIDADLARCEQHCHPTVSSADHTPSLTVPPALITTQWWPESVCVRSGMTSCVRGPTIDPRAGAPPLSIRFCSFQI